MAEKKRSVIKFLTDEKKENIVIKDETGKIHKGTIVIKPIYCGKHCKGCPHYIYKYVCWKQDGRTRWKYIGKVKTTGGLIKK
jgi:hypothetical protein